MRKKKVTNTILRTAKVLTVGIACLLININTSYGIDKHRDQLWTFWKSQGATNNIVNYLGGCLGLVGVDVNPPVPGTPVEVYTCNPPGDSDEGFDNTWVLFQLKEKNKLTPYYYIVNHFEKANNGRQLCLGVVGPDSPNWGLFFKAGARAELYYCTPGGSDRGHDHLWTLENVGPPAVGYFQIRNRAKPNLCLGVVGQDSHKGLGERVEIYNCAGIIS